MKYQKEIAANNLKKLRLARGWKQKDVAKLIGLAYSDRISHWEIGTAEPGIVNLFRLSIIYKTTPLKIYPLLKKVIGENILQ